MTASAHTDRFVQASSKVFRPGRGGRKIDRFVVHHQAGFMAGTLGMMTSGSRRVSATYVIGSIGDHDGEAVCVVQEQDTPATNDDVAWNQRSITFEIENTDKGGRYPANLGKPSHAAHEKVARILADAGARYGIPLDRDHVVMHRELYSRFRVGYATACPGELDRDWVIARALEIQGQGPAPKPLGGGYSAPAAAAKYPIDTYAGYDIISIQRIVGAGQDDVYGPETTQKVREWQQRVGGLLVDGYWGPASQARADALALGAPASGPQLQVDGIWGGATTRALQAALGVEVDGSFGRQSITALQRRVGSPDDGLYGPNTKRAMQRHLGVPDDGIVGPRTVRALQTRLNAGTF